MPMEQYDANTHDPQESRSNFNSFYQAQIGEEDASIKYIQLRPAPEQPEGFIVVSNPSSKERHIT